MPMPTAIVLPVYDDDDAVCLCVVASALTVVPRIATGTGETVLPNGRL
jgi:hypothetical protein